MSLIDRLQRLEAFAPADCAACAARPVFVLPGQPRPSASCPECGRRIAPLVFTINLRPFEGDSQEA